jgi:hypothetical protein
MTEHDPITFMGRQGCDRMVVGFITACVIRANHY